MKVAIYARYSTDIQDESSIAGQVTNCEAVAEANGWLIVERYMDEAITGTDDSRPGFQRLLADSEAGRFDGIIVDETSRLTRSIGVLPQVIRDLALRDQFLVDCKGFDSRIGASKLLAALYSGLDDMELDKIKARTHRGLCERAKDGFSAGGRAYGYSSEKINPDDDKSKFRKIVDPDQADVVREIFERYADGESPLAIARDLNQRNIPSPGATWKRRGGKTSDGKWRVSAIYGDTKRGTGILCNELYRGRYVWNRTEWRKVPGTRRRKSIIRNESEWMRREMPELRIVDDALWVRAQMRIKETQRRTAATREKHGKKAAGGRTSRYLLSGLMKCDECGSNYIMADTRSYACSAHKSGACKNGIRVKREVAEGVILEDIETMLLSDTALARFRQTFVRLIEEQKRRLAGTKSDRAIGKELDDIDRKLNNLVGFIAEHGHDDSVKAKLDALESRRSELVALSKVEMPDFSNLSDLLCEGLARYRDQIVRLARIPEAGTATQVARARSIMKRLLGPIPLYPQYDEGILLAGLGIKTKALAQFEGSSAFASISGSGGRI